MDYVLYLLRALYRVKWWILLGTALIKANYNGIVGFNGALVGGGVLGIMPPSQTAWLHNLFTLGIGLESMTPLLKKEETKETVPTIDVTADSVVA